VHLIARALPDIVYETNEGNAMMILLLGGSKHGQRHDLEMNRPGNIGGCLV
jgi:hypothetical protein